MVWQMTLTTDGDYTSALFLFLGRRVDLFFPLQPLPTPPSQANVAEQLAETQRELKTDTLKKKTKHQHKQQHKTRDVKGISKPPSDAVVPFCLHAL